MDHGREPSKLHAYQAHVGTLRATSRGWVKLQSTNPKDHPIIEPNYLSTGTLFCYEFDDPAFSQLGDQAGAKFG